MFCEDKKCPLYIECMERLEALPYCASKAAELATTANQQLKAEIAARLSKVDVFPKYNIPGPVDEFIEAMRQLSAV